MAEPESPTGRDDDGEPQASEILDALAASKDDRIPLSAVAEVAGSRVHGLALLVFVLPEVPPLPLPSASTVLGVPLILISIHLALFGEGALLPPRLASASIPRSVFVAAARYLAPAFRWLEGISRPRWLWLARRERLVGIICLYLAIILILPIPLLNSPPAACLAAVALGMIQRDGVFIAGGILGGLIVTGVLIGVIDAAGSFFLR